MIFHHFQSKEQVQKFWQSAGLSLNELIPDDPSLVTEYAWLADIVESAPVASVPKDIPTPHADPELVRLFKSINNQDSTGDDEQILAYIREVCFDHLHEIFTLSSCRIWIQKKNITFEILSYRIWKHV